MTDHLKVRLWDFLQSKKQLEQIVQETNCTFKKIIVNTYCKFPIGEDSSKRVYVSMKPSSFVIVKIINGKCTGAKFFHTKRPSEEIFPCYWTEEKLLKWTKKYGSEIYLSVEEAVKYAW